MAAAVTFSFVMRAGIVLLAGQASVSIRRVGFSEILFFGNEIIWRTSCLLIAFLVEFGIYQNSGVGREQDCLHGRLNQWTSGS